MQHWESIADPGIIKKLRSGGNDRVEGGVRGKRRGGRKRVQRNFTGMPTEYMVNTLLRVGVVRKGGIALLICGAELLYGVARGVTELI